jgi:hypothetical protein
LLDSTFSQPDAIDPLRFVERSIARTPRQYRAEVLIKATLDEANAQIPADLGVLTVVDDGVLLVCYADNLSWLARFLLNLTLPLVIHQPVELKQELQRWQARIEQLLEGFGDREPTAQRHP